MSFANLFAVVLAGGRSLRFGTDKLGAYVAGRALLDHTLLRLPADAEILLVGPPRDVGRPVIFVREDPPGGGPAAGLIAGLRAALERGARELLVVPGDAPRAGEGAALLLQALREGRATAVVATDAAETVQPLHLALTDGAARALVELAGPGAGAGDSARGLLARLQPPAVRCRLPAELQFDVDTPADLHSHGLDLGGEPR